MAVARLEESYGSSETQGPTVPQRNFIVKYSTEEEGVEEQPTVVLLDTTNPDFVKQCGPNCLTELNDYLSDAEACRVDISNLARTPPNMQDLVESLLDMHLLVELKISDCSITTEMQHHLQFGAAVNLQVLILDSLKLRHLHPSVGRLCNLRLLSLQHNHLGDLPLTIRLLRNLEYLDITGNYFRYVPGAVFHLQSLKALEGLNACPFDKMETMGWKKESEDIKWLIPIGGQEHQQDQVESLQEAAIRSSIGMDCWLIPLPERHRRALAEYAVTHNLCENCLKSVRKISLEKESDGYTIFVEIAVFCGVRNVPFLFVACSKACMLSTVAWFRAYQNYAKTQIPHHAWKVMPRCEYRLKFLQDLYDYPEEYNRPGGAQSRGQVVQMNLVCSTGTSRFRHRTSKCAVM